MFGNVAGWVQTYGVRFARPARRVALVCAIAGLAPSCRSQPVEQRVLFIGNSYVYTYDLPGTFKVLADAGHHRTSVGMAATGGWLLQQHVDSRDTQKLIADSAWTTIVLQEQSVMPALRTERERQMYPAVRSLTTTIRAHHAKPLLFATWGRRDGLPTAGFATFEAMQGELDAGYETIAEETGAAMILAGDAWVDAREKAPTIALWGPDGSHPSPAGTYLNACVIYATIFRQSPVGLPPSKLIDAATARALQAVAARVVLTPAAP